MKKLSKGSSNLGITLDKPAVIVTKSKNCNWVILEGSGHLVMLPILLHYMYTPESSKIYPSNSICLSNNAHLSGLN